MGKAWKSLPGLETYRKPSGSRADKVSAESYLETTPMNSTCQAAQEQQPANLAALHQTLREMFASTKSAIPTTKERPVNKQGPVIVIRGK